MSRHVQNPDSSIIERRLRPIYDWLDSGNNKKALQECEKVLKKNLNLQCGKALKALTLLRMGRDQECITILDNLTSEKPTDDATLQVISLCYREMEQIDKICKLYETAVKLDPTNEELHTHLFMSYVKIGDFKLQQQSAMALYKQKPKNPYYCWIVMSIILQATRGEGETDESKRKVLLSLAERMMTKLVDDNKMDAEQEVQLYILVLKLLEKYEEVLHLLDGPLGEKLQSANIIHLKLDYYLKLENWGKVNETCKFILNESFDRWAVWKHYIKSVFKLYTSNSNADTANSNLKSLDGLDNTPEKCHEFICGIIESGSDNAFLLRGPYLARFELCFKLQEHRFKCDDLLGDVLQLFVEYFRLFGHKPCCVLDLKIYLNLLSADQKSELGIRLMKEVGIGPTSVPQTADQMQLHIGALQLSRLCGAHRNLSKDHLQAMMTALVLHYQHGYQTYGKELPSTDIGPADNYALMAVHVMYDLSKTENGIQYLVAAIALLSNLIRNSPSNFHAKLLVVKIYHMLGDVIGANNIFYSLDIKHIQLDSLGYIHCGQLATTGMFSICSVHYDTTIKFFSSNYKDSTEHLTFCYKFGSFFKLDEFMDFRERMNNSLHYATVLVDRVMLNLMDCSSVTGLNNLYISISELRINWTKLRDNKDLGIYVTWDPEFAERPVDQTEEIQRLFEQDMKFLKLRVYVLYCIKGTIEVSKSLDGLKTASLEALKRTLKDWKELEEDARNSDLEPIPDVIFPKPSGNV
ncbi:hypothetical protein ABEB36_014306 [Hypothenemus hampei]|uniref:N-terminal acetyltransferase B complex subunit MDM20 homolog n=1 Tax=Hypothenemus hampei TaxID=57062 RepID=A0ABD1E4X4_HYPHA